MNKYSLFPAEAIQHKNLKVSDKEILKFIRDKKLCTIRDLTRLGLSEARVRERMRKLCIEVKVKRFRINKGGGTSPVRNLFDIFGDYVDRIFFYVPECEDYVCDRLLIEFRLLERKSRGLEHITTYHLRNCLPQSLFMKIIIARRNKQRDGYKCENTEKSVNN